VQEVPDSIGYLAIVRAVRVRDDAISRGSDRVLAFTRGISAASLSAIAINLKTKQKWNRLFSTDLGEKLI
jgi:hypothetical protein